MSRTGTIDREEAAPAIDPRIDARRRAVREARLGRVRRILLAMAVTATVAAAGYGITRTGALDVDVIDVTGAVHTDANAIRTASGLRVGDPLLDLDLDRAAAQVRALPWVADASVDRSWSGTVGITVSERVPVAAVHDGANGWLLVDADRRVLATAATQPADLPAVEGVRGAPVGQSLDGSAQAAVTVARALSPGLRTRVIAVDGSHPDALVLPIRPAGSIRFGGADDVAQKITSLQAVFAQADLAGLCVVDVRVPDSPVLTRGAPCA